MVEYREAVTSIIAIVKAKDKKKYPKIAMAKKEILIKIKYVFGMSATLLFIPE